MLLADRESALFLVRIPIHCKKIEFIIPVQKLLKLGKLSHYCLIQIVAMPSKKATSIKRIQLIAKSFPSLERVAGITPWNPDEIAEVAKEMILYANCEAIRASSQFILGVWDCDRKWPCGRFDVLWAMRHWNDEDQQAFRSWCAAPWWNSV